MDWRAVTASYVDASRRESFDNISRPGDDRLDIVDLMRAKIGTALDRDLLKRARSMAARQGKPLNQVIEEALREHLARGCSKGSSIVARTRGNLRVSKEILERILREEPGVFDL
jgi:hypothetical protein